MERGDTNVSSRKIRRGGRKQTKAVLMLLLTCFTSDVGCIKEEERKKDGKGQKRQP
jgi:hypothetical protein